MGSSGDMIGERGVGREGGKEGREEERKEEGRKEGREKPIYPGWHPWR